MCSMMICLHCMLCMCNMNVLHKWLEWVCLCGFAVMLVMLYGCKD